MSQIRVCDAPHPYRMREVTPLEPMAGLAAVVVGKVIHVAAPDAIGQWQVEGARRYDFCGATCATKWLAEFLPTIEAASEEAA